MMRNFLLYWKPRTVDDVKEDLGNEPLRHVASDQLYRAQSADVVWAVTVRPPGELFVVGRIQVGECVNEEEAANLLEYVPWEAKFHVIESRKKVLGNA